MAWWQVPKPGEFSPYSTADEAAGRPHGAARRRPRPVKVDTEGRGANYDIHRAVVFGLRQEDDEEK
jgi:hypothetical protein